MTPVIDLRQGDCRDVMAAMPESSIDAIVTDPPYDLTAVSRNGSPSTFIDNPYGRARIGNKGAGGGFMGKGWDASGIAFDPAMWAEALRVLKPGGYLLSFGGTRTYHRMTCAIEDAGFEIRDCLMYLYGSGFPKSKNVALSIDKREGLPNRGHRVAHASRFHPDGTFEPNGEAIPPYKGKTEASAPWEGWGTALKPAWEPIVMARKPFAGTVAANVLAHGTGALNIDATRIELNGQKKTGGGCAGASALHGGGIIKRSKEDNTLGRWPANVILDDEAAAMLDEQVGDLTITGYRSERSKDRDVPGTTWGTTNHRSREYPGEQSSGPSRFFYCAKASRDERNAGLDEMVERANRINAPRASEAEKFSPLANHHPTVKPINLMRWLIRLVTPPRGVVLDPFLGSGSTGCAAVLEGFDFVGIELDDSEGYLEIAERRIAHWQREAKVQEILSRPYDEGSQR